MVFSSFREIAKRPPVEETASFLQSLLASHGPNYLEKLFGSKARDALAPLGGVEKVAIALSESQTIEGKFKLLDFEWFDIYQRFNSTKCFLDFRFLHKIYFYCKLLSFFRFWCSTASHAIRLGAFALRLYGCRKRRFRNAEIAWHQRLRAGRREILP